MSALAFIAAMVKAVIWPATIIVLVLVFRRRLNHLLGKGLRRLKAGPFEAEWDEIADETIIAVAASPVEATPHTQVDIEHQPQIAVSNALQNVRYSQLDILRMLADELPQAAVVSSWVLVDQRLSELAKRYGLGSKGSPGQKVDALLKAKVITPEQRQALDGLRRLRNLAAHGMSDDLNTAQAVQYVNLAKSVLSQLEADHGFQPTLFDLP